MSLLSVSDLYKQFNLEAGFFARFGKFVKAVNGVSFNIGKNESYGLVGESGCGKTTTARLLVRMYEADSGEITFNNDESTISVGSLKKEELRSYREKVRYVFQDPARSLNPRLSVYEVLVSGCRDPLKRKGLKESEIRNKAKDILNEVGLQSGDLEKKPSEFSGGQRQRISIARSLLPEPELLICDEVVSALDVSIQGQILNLLLDIREKRNISFLFIAHDLKVACYFCDRIGVMYAGELMEEAPAADLYREGLHPYTQLLFSSAARVEDDHHTEAQRRSRNEERVHTEARRHGEHREKKECYHLHNQTNIQLTDNEETGKKKNILNNTDPSVPERTKSSLCLRESILSCSFAPRCVKATERCFTEHPELREIKAGHKIRCFDIF